MNNQAVSGSGDLCPVCNGTGWELFEKMVDGYDTPLEYSRPCPRCKVKNREHDETGIPPQFREADIYKFGFDSYIQNMDKFKQVIWDFFENFKTWEKSGKGLYLWSKTSGSGKSFLASSAARSIMLKYDLQMRFVMTPDYLAAVGESYKRQEGMEDKSRVFRECALLVLDDLGCFTASGLFDCRHILESYLPVDTLMDTWQMMIEVERMNDEINSLVAAFRKMKLPELLKSYAGLYNVPGGTMETRRLVRQWVAAELWSRSLFSGIGRKTKEALTDLYVRVKFRGLFNIIRNAAESHG